VDRVWWVGAGRDAPRERQVEGAVVIYDGGLYEGGLLDRCGPPLPALPYLSPSVPPTLLPSSLRASLCCVRNLSASARRVIRRARASVPHGCGRASWPGGEYYEGGWQRGVPHGHGRLVKPGPEVYVGAWERGRRAGFGSLVTPQAEYVGGFRCVSRPPSPNRFFECVWATRQWSWQRRLWPSLRAGRATGAGQRGACSWSILRRARACAETVPSTASARCCWRAALGRWRGSSGVGARAGRRRSRTRPRAPYTLA
jgi:hypothetical protein